MNFFKFTKIQKIDKNHRNKSIPRWQSPEFSLVQSISEFHCFRTVQIYTPLKMLTIYCMYAFNFLTINSTYLYLGVQLESYCTGC